MSAAAVEETRRAGLLIESSKGIGFYIAPKPSPTTPTEEPDTQSEQTAPEPKANADGAPGAPPESSARLPIP